MGRRRQKQDSPLEDLFELMFEAVQFAWYARPLHGALMGVGLALILGLLLPGILNAVSKTAGPIGMILGLLATLFQWMGALGAVLCFGCALMNLIGGGGGGDAARAKPVSKLPQRGHVTSDIPFIRKDLLTPSELKFFKVLREAFPEVLICPQVALAAVVDIPDYFNKGRYKYANRAPFAAKFADFAVVDPDSGEVHAIIELDDYSHDSAERKAEDAARDAMLKKVGIPVHRFDARRMPTVAQLHQLFADQGSDA